MVRFMIEVNIKIGEFICSNGKKEINYIEYLAKK